MLRRGIMPPPNTRWARRAAKYGWYSQMPYPPPQQGAPGYPMHDPNSQWAADCALRKGITVAMVGIAIVIGLSWVNQGDGGPWLLFGLIPLFVGIAQVIIALLSGARLGPFGYNLNPPPQNGQAFGPQQYQEPAAPPFTREPAPGPYAWRPGPTTELEPPHNPPDIRNP